MMNWNKNTDCCKWDGVSCNHFTGDAIAINLSCGMLRGTIYPNTTLFRLPHLQMLNLAYNDFTASQLPREISSSLTHLNISESGFTSEISSEFLFLPKWISLDLSRNDGMRIQPFVLSNLLQNSSYLRELLIPDVDVGWVLPTYLNISSSLKSLDLRSTRLQGKLPRNIFNLQYLKTLDLSDNEVTGSLPKVVINQSSLISLDLSGNRLQGKLPANIFNIQNLEILDLSSNDYLTGPLPDVNMSINTPLKWLDVSSINLSGMIPYSIGHLKSLNYLDLTSTNLSGEIPDSIGNLTSLNYLLLSSCSFTGSLPKSLVNLRHLTTLYLSFNKLSGTLPSFLFTLPLLEDVLLGDNMFTGGLPSEFFNCRSLRKLSLWKNQFDGDITQGSTQPSFIKLVNLTYLDLSSNNFRGSLQLETLFSSLPNLERLYLSYSGLTVVTDNSTNYVNPDFQYLGLASCKLTMFPTSLRAMKYLQSLDLSENNIHGRIPDWAGEIGGEWLYYLDLSHNSITGLPQFRDGLQFLFLKSNLIEEPFPVSICNMKQLIALDMSNNNFFGMLPQCFGNISSILLMVDLGKNHFHGTIPNVYEDYGKLEGIILNGNQLEGEVPSSLSKCQSLKVLDLGNNRLNGTFPSWLGDLPNLQALVLKSNNFHGPIVSSPQVKLPFPSLKVVDLSRNGFVGHLPSIYLQNFNAMKDVIRMSPQPEYVNMGGVYYSVIIAVKGQLLPFPKITIDYTIVDLSFNKFEGEIPSIIGDLTSLIVLDLSHNSLTGGIPFALGKMAQIESLDLSWNQLTKEIPRSLVDLTFLAFLNLSQNHLVGRIPTGKQFDTFEGNSFGGNPELCGIPLSKKCELPHEPKIEDGEDTEFGFTWRVVMWGYGGGTLLGLVMGYIMLSTRKPKWLHAVVDAGENMIQARKRERSHVFLERWN